MHKVYCKNCKYYERRQVGLLADEDTIFDRCLKPSKIYKDAIGDSFLTDFVDCNEQNKDWKCKHYKRKWWKFWIKNPKLSGKVKNFKAWPLPNILVSEIPPMPICKSGKWVKGEKIKGCPACKKGDLFFYWQGKYYHAKCDKCGYLYDTGRKMTSKEKKENKDKR